MPGACSAKGLEGRLRRKRKDIYSAQRFSARHGWDRGGKEKGRDEGGGGKDLGAFRFTAINYIREIISGFCLGSDGQYLIFSPWTMRSFAGTYGSWRPAPLLEILQWAPPDAANCPAREEQSKDSLSDSGPRLPLSPACSAAPASPPPSARLREPTYTNSLTPAVLWQSGFPRLSQLPPLSRFPAEVAGAEFRPLPPRLSLRVSLGHCILEGRGPALKPAKL